jgi:hypothetical protein
LAPIADEITPADHFGRDLHPTHDRYRIEDGVKRAANGALAPHGCTNGQYRQCATNPGHCTHEPAGHLSLRVPRRLLKHSHAPVLSMIGT